MSPNSIHRRQILGSIVGGVSSLAGCSGFGEIRQRQRNSNEKDSAGREGTHYNSIVIFRNDDPAPWADVDKLSAVNDIFIDNQVPLTQGIVPYDENQNESLTPEHEVVQYLSTVTEEHGELFENALHGYSHARETDFYWGSEFGGLPYEEQHQKITQGLQIFNESFGNSPVTFIPPFNTYDEITVQVLVENEFKLTSGSYYFQKEHFGENGFWEGGNILHLPNNLAMEDSESQEVREIGAIKNDYDTNTEKRGLNVIMLHYDRYSGEREKQILEEIVEYTLEDDSKSMTLNGFANQIERGDIRRTKNGWIINED